MEDTQPTLANWRLPPFNREAFSKVREIIPTASINLIRELGSENIELMHKKLTVKISDDNETLLDEFLNKTTVDAFQVSHKGKKVYMWHSNYCSSTQPHIIFSVSTINTLDMHNAKNITIGLIHAILKDIISIPTIAMKPQRERRM